MKFNHEGVVMCIAFTMMSFLCLAVSFAGLLLTSTFLANVYICSFCSTGEEIHTSLEIIEILFYKRRAY